MLDLQYFSAKRKHTRIKVIFLYTPYVFHFVLPRSCSNSWYICHFNRQMLTNTPVYTTEALHAAETRHTSQLTIIGWKSKKWLIFLNIVFWSFTIHLRDTIGSPIHLRDTIEPGKFVRGWQMRVMVCALSWCHCEPVWTRPYGIRVLDIYTVCLVWLVKNSASNEMLSIYKTLEVTSTLCTATTRQKLLSTHIRTHATSQPYFALCWAYSRLLPA